MVSVTSSWISWVSSATGCASRGFWLEGLGIDVSGVVGSGKGGLGVEG